jgi:GT2 family glycosyltransferase
LDLSYAARTADNDFSYQFYLAGYKVLVVPTSVTWHLETHQYGGLKKSSEEYSKLCNDDRRKFEERLLRWGKISTRFNV